MRTIDFDNVKVVSSETVALALARALKNLVAEERFLVHRNATLAARVAGDDVERRPRSAISRRARASAVPKLNMFERWTWSDASSATRAREALLGVCAVSVVVIVSLLARLSSMGRRRAKGTTEATRRARARRTTR